MVEFVTEVVDIHRCVYLNSGVANNSDLPQVKSRENLTDSPSVVQCYHSPVQYKYFNSLIITILIILKMLHIIIYIYIYLYMYIYIYTIYIYVCVYIYIYNLYIYIFVCIYIYIYIYLYICVYIYNIYIYILFLKCYIFLIKFTCKI